jgi:hypothetical protein
MVQQFDVAAARHLPPIQVDAPFFDPRPSDATEAAKRVLEALQGGGHAIGIGLVHARVRL